MRKYYKHYSYRPESFKEFCAMAAYAAAVGTVVATPIALGSYFAQKKEIAEIMTEHLGYEIKSVESVDLSVEQLDEDTKYYVTLGGKLAQESDGQKKWSEKYEVNKKDYENIKRKTSKDEKTVFNLYVETCDYLQKNIFPYVSQASESDSLSHSVNMSSYVHQWVGSDNIM